MKNKLDYLHKLIIQDNLQFFGLNETWLTENIANSFPSMRSHLIIRRDRLIGRGGGVALYFNSLFRSNIILSHHDYNIGIEFILTESYLTDIDTLVHLVMYRLPHINKNCLINVFDHIRPLIINCQRYVFCGDLNLNVSDHSNLTFLSNLLSEHGLKRIEFGPTHFT